MKIKLFSLLILSYCISLIFTGNIYSQSSNKKEAEKAREQIKSSNIRTIRTSQYSYKFGDPEKKGIRLESVTYDTNGRRIEWATFDSSGAIVSKFKYRYDSIGNRIQEIKYKPDNSVALKTVFTFDATGKEIETVTYDSVGDIETKTVSTLDSTGRPVFWEKYKADGTIARKKNFKYDANGNLIEESETIQDIKAVGRKTKKVEGVGEKKSYAYDANGNVIEEVSFAANGNIISKTKYKYDSTGHVLEIEDQQPQRKGTGSRSIITTTASEKRIYSYDAKGALFEEDIFDVEGKISSKTVYFYNDLGNSLSEVIFNVKLDEPESIIKYVYSLYQK